MLKRTQGWLQRRDNCPRIIHMKKLTDTKGFIWKHVVVPPTDGKIDARATLNNILLLPLHYFLLLGDSCFLLLDLRIRRSCFFPRFSKIKIIEKSTSFPPPHLIRCDLISSVKNHSVCVYMNNTDSRRNVELSSVLLFCTACPKESQNTQLFSFSFCDRLSENFRNKIRKTRN